MKQYQPVTEEVIQALRRIVGEKYVKTDAAVLDVYKSDESLAQCRYECQLRRRSGIRGNRSSHGADESDS